MIPTVDNETDVLILQHRREREHPFNTARIVDRSLAKSRLICGRSRELGSQTLPLLPGAALLYPGPHAKQLPCSLKERPSQLVILDGTWSHAKSLLRDVPAIRSLPRYQLNPKTPGKYRIRLEPTDTALSTVEATVEALRILEPNLAGLDLLLQAFYSMVDQQLAHPNAQYDGLTLAQKQQQKPNIPYALIHDFNNIVIAYGESAGGEWKPENCKGYRSRKRTPVYWVAKRLGKSSDAQGESGEQTFSTTIDPGPQGLTHAQLTHMELGPEHFENAMSQEEFSESWRSFLRPADTVGVFQHGSLDLLTNCGMKKGPSFVLKGVKTQPNARRRALHEVLEAHRLKPEPAEFPGRAGRRLAGAIAYAKFLHQRATSSEI